MNQILYKLFKRLYMYNAIVDLLDHDLIMNGLKSIYL